MFLHSEQCREDQCPHAAPLAIQAAALSTTEGTAKRPSGDAQEENQAVGRYEQRGPAETTALQGTWFPHCRLLSHNRQLSTRDNPCSLSAASHWRGALHTSSMFRTLSTPEKSPGRNVTVLEPRDRVPSQENVQQKPETSQELKEPT